jgi:hypothetical protein
MTWRTDRPAAPRGGEESGARATPPADAVEGQAVPVPLGLRGHLDLARENGGPTPWCGPAALALALGCSPAEACRLLREMAPQWYPAAGPVVTAFWRDLLAVLDRCGVAHDPMPAGPSPRPPLLGFLRRGGEEGAPLRPGWYLLRVTGHFLVLRSRGFGLGQVHDNRHSGVLVTDRVLGRRRVSHAARLRGGPLPAVEA